MNNQNVIPIFFSIDDAYAPFLSVALNSAIQNCSLDNHYKAIVLHEDLNKKHIEKLSKLATENFEIEFVPMKTGMETITDRMSNRLRCDYFTLTIYFRLFIAQMFPQYDKAIYIDSDVAVVGDLAELYNVELGDNLIGGCPDRSIEGVGPLMRYIENAVGSPNGEYINSGVLLMNLKQLREVEFDKHFLNLLNTYHFDCIAPDQDYINAICKGRIHYLPDIWDTMPNDNRQIDPNAKLIHYNLFSKPWCYDNIQYGDVFWKYAQDSGYLEEIQEYKANYTDEQKQSDEKCMALLVERGDIIWQTEITFKKLSESGVKIRL